MPTSSFFHDIVISDQEKAKRLIATLEKMAEGIGHCPACGALFYMKDGKAESECCWESIQSGLPQEE